VVRHAPRAPDGIEADHQLREVGHEEGDPLAALQAEAPEPLATRSTVSSSAR
jgi:hypothetical protein